jgi:hypothetical protein
LGILAFGLARHQPHLPLALNPSPVHHMGAAMIDMTGMPVV